MSALLEKSAAPPGASEAIQGTAQFGLEDDRDDQHQGLRAASHQPVERGKPGDGADQGDNQGEQDDAAQELDSLRAAYQPQDAIDHCGHQQDVNKVAQVDFGQDPEDVLHLVSILEQIYQDGLLGVQAVLRFIEQPGMRAIGHLVCDLFTAMSGEAVHDADVWLGKSD
jgi:hypothetical protein